MLGDERVPAPSKKLVRPKHTDDMYEAKQQGFIEETQRHKRARERARVCELTHCSKKQIDVRLKKLAVMPSTGVPTTMAPFKTLPGA